MKEYQRNSFPLTYTVTDIALLAEADLALRRLAGPATFAIFKREYELFKRKEYVRLANIGALKVRLNIWFERVFSKRTKRARYRGVAKVTTQAFLEAIAHNLKKAVRFIPDQAIT